MYLFRNSLQYTQQKEKEKETTKGKYGIFMTVIQVNLYGFLRVNYHKRAKYYSII